MLNQKILKVSEFFNNEISPLVLGAFFSRYVFCDNSKYIVTYSSFKKSQKIFVPNFDFDNYYNKYLRILNEESLPNSNWLRKDDLSINIKVPQGQIFYILENDLNLSSDSFYNKLYVKLLKNSWLFENGLTEQKKKFIRGYMEIRGSVDTGAAYITQDYFYNSNFEIKKARLFVDYLNVPYYLVNINFRELQNDYCAGHKRNTQLRFNIFWYMKNIGIMNEYKAAVFALSRDIFRYKKQGNIIYFECDDINYKNSNLFDERLNYYSTKVFGNKLSSEEVKKLREGLGLDEKSKNIRNSALVELMRAYLPDECVCCKDKYDIKDRSFVHKKTGKYYFELHHVISLGDNKELDDENNLVKVCPTCHKTLKKGAGTELEQKELIDNILKHSPNVLDFAEHFFNTNDREEIIDLIYKNLK